MSALFLSVHLDNGCLLRSSHGLSVLISILRCSCKCDNVTFMEQAHRHGAYTKETLQFMERILSTSGVGEEAYMPSSLDSTNPHPYSALLICRHAKCCLHSFVNSLMQHLDVTRH